MSYMWITEQLKLTLHHIAAEVLLITYMMDTLQHGHHKLKLNKSPTKWLLKAK